MFLFSKDLGIDLGTSNILIYAAGKGVVLREHDAAAHSDAMHAAQQSC